MSRSGYSDDCDDPLVLGRWRAAVRSAMRGKRGQAFLREMLAALDAMPNKRLVREHLQVDGTQCAYGEPDVIIGADELVDATGNVLPMGGVCALGSVGAARGMDMSGIAHAMTCEIVYWNDEFQRETPEERWVRMRQWTETQITKSKPDSPG